MNTDDLQAIIHCHDHALAIFQLTQLFPVDLYLERHCTAFHPFGAAHDDLAHIHPPHLQEYPQFTILHADYQGRKA